MKKIQLVVLLLLSAFVTFSFAQQQPSDAKPLTILAVMVEFQKDNISTTVGDGTFNSIYGTVVYGDSIIDPLPHNAEYFDKKLLFAKNYFAKVSSGNQQVNYTVFPTVVTVTKQMRDYSPAINSNELKPMADLSAEVWQLADEAAPSGFKFSDYDLFIIFHAGVSRSVSLPGSLGNSRDLPSVYLGLGSLKSVYGNTFTGFSVQGGAFNITNSALLPQTENRIVESFGSQQLVEITTNGLMVSTIGSHLGLPDLFDTNTGKSAIGRFGLMDGQAIYAYAGAIPPAPSAWEKIQLGWITPREISTGSSVVNIATAQGAILSDATIIKIPITSAQYYLVENRQQDANNDKAKVTVWYSGKTETLELDIDTTGFNSASISKLRGVVVDVDEFDMALPGSGMVIWHIDEKVIAENRSGNTVNNDRTKLGVRVEEADGSYDIGREFTTIFGETLVAEGEQNDMWFLGNDAKLFKNIFDGDSRPATVSVNGSSTLVSMKNFSKPGKGMSFDLSFGDSLLAPISNINLPSEASSISGFNINGGVILVTLTNSSVDVYNSVSGVTKSYLTKQLRAPLTYQDNTGRYLVIVDDSVRVIRYDDSGAATENILSTAGVYYFGTLSTTSGVTLSLPVVGAVEVWNIPAIGNPTKKYSIPLPADVSPFSVSQVSEVGGELYILMRSGAQTKIQRYSSTGTLVAETNVFSNARRFSFVDFQSGSIVTERALQLIVSGNNDAFEQITEVYNILGTTFQKQSSMMSPLSLLAPINETGELYSIGIASDKGQIIYTPSGAVLDGFPLALSSGGYIISNSILTINGKYFVASLTSVGDIYMFDPNSATILPQFPIRAVDVAVSTNPTFQLFGTDKKYVAVSAGKNVKLYEVKSSSVGIIYSGNSQGASSPVFVLAKKLSPNAGVTELLPKDKVYNYPNPVNSGSTAIRYFAKESGSVTITIMDLAGELVTKLTGIALGGFDNEIQWNINDIQSGVYLAHVELTAGGHTESQIIKIAVVK